jgi:hypothetical protein
MAAPYPPPPEIPPSVTVSAAPIERAIRHAVYLTGGLVLLAFATLNLTSALGEVAECASNQQQNCASSGIYYLLVPEIGGGVVLLIIGIVLLILAHAARRTTS